ncbi:hypothetical protein MAP00_007694 [Monascus purpureus]|nr:hypothetical protein MAP00_007694 [Monascus purpureus]
MEELELGLGLMPRSNDGYGPYRGHAALVTTAVLTSISGFIVVLRLFTRSLLVKYIGREDWIIIAALACSFVYLGLTVSEVHFGLGYHSYNLPHEELGQQLKRLWSSFPFYNASLSFTRFSILFQYLRIFPNHSFRLACFIVMGIVGSFSIWTIVSGFLHCNPISDFWTESDPGYCLSFEGVWVFNSVMNIVTDLILLALPMYPLAQLQLPKPQKIGLMLMFSMGGLVVIISAIRVYSIYDLGRRTDMSWDSAISTCWTAAECNAAIICACLPPPPPTNQPPLPQDSLHRLGPAQRAEESRRLHAGRRGDLPPGKTVLRLRLRSGSGQRQDDRLDRETVRWYRGHHRSGDGVPPGRRKWASERKSVRYGDGE